MSDPPGPRLASGRDCDIFAIDRQHVLRRARDGRSLEPEAAIMRYVHEHGYPVPEVFDASGRDIILERVDGQNLFDDLARHPQRIRSNARLLADLHARLAVIPAPDWLAPAGGLFGSAIVHLDLHPLNVLMSRDGARVIDWTNAARGEAGADVATTWLLLATADLPRTPVPPVVLDAVRRLFLRYFLAAADRDAARPWLGAILERRARDPHMSRRRRPARCERGSPCAARPCPCAPTTRAGRDPRRSTRSRTGCASTSHLRVCDAAAQRRAPSAALRLDYTRVVPWRTT
ncbi:MAG: phosphotransferase [Acidimicrobiales bacterium]